MGHLSDVRFAARMLAKDKGTTALAAVALALGLGANVAIFSMVRLMVWTPLPYPQAEELVSLPQTNANKGFRQAAVSLEDARDWSKAPAFASVAVYQSRPVAISGEGEPQHVLAMQVSPEFFRTIGVQPALGRSFSDAEGPETESRVAILSHELWQGTFQGAPSVLGGEIRLDGRNHTVVGVMPAGFQYLFERNDVWTPLSLAAAQRIRGSRGLRAVGRLNPGVTIERAGEEVRAISMRVEKEDPKSGLGWRGAVRPLADEIMGREARMAARTLLGATGFVLLIACANVASLLLARGASRGRELAIRASLGAGRGSLVGLQLVESLLLALLGGLFGVLSAVWTIPLLKRIAPPDMELLQRAALDWNTLLFGLGLTLATGLLFGLIPAWQLTRGDLARSLQEASRGSSGGRHRLLKSLVIGEMALALVLVAATTLMTRSLTQQLRKDPGFDKAGLFAANVLLPAARYPEDEQVAAFYSSVLDGLRRNGSVQSAALVQTLPLGGNNSYSQVRVEGETGATRDNIAGFMIVSPGYFRTMGIPLLAGRDFTADDTADRPNVAIVNRAFAQRYWPGVSDPVGRRLRGGGEDAPWVTVVGMVQDVRHTSLSDPPRPEFYRPHRQSRARIMMLVARARGAAENAAGAMRSAVRQVDPEQPLFRMESVAKTIGDRMAGGRATTQVLGLLAAVALVLAAVGTYGVMAYISSRRLREMGIRLALGATSRDVFGRMLAGGMTLAAIGLAVGLPATFGVAPLLRSIGSGLEDVNSRDGVSYLLVGALLLLAALAACAVPAWRVTRVAPAAVLRDE